MKAKLILLLATLLAAQGSAFARAVTDPSPLLTKPADQLLAILNSDADRKAKADACRELGVVGTAKVVPTLVGLLGDTELHHMARYALETIPGPAVERAIREELPWVHGKQLVGVIGSLGVRHDAKAVKPLAALLKSPDADVAQASARALGFIGTAEATRALEKGMTATAPQNRAAVCEGLMRCAEGNASKGKAKDAVAIFDWLRNVPGLADHLRAAALHGAILYRGPKDTALLEQSLASSERILFHAAARAALELDGPEVTKVVASALNKIPADNQIVLAQVLGSRHDTLALPALTAQAGSGSKPVRIAAVRAIAAVGAGRATPTLVALSADRDSEVVQAAIDGLAGIPGSGADAAVLNLARSTDSSQQLTGLELIARRRMFTALPDLLKAAANGDSKVRSSAIQKLGRLGTAAEVPAILKLVLNCNEAAGCGELAEALGSICANTATPQATGEPIVDAIPNANAIQKGALLGILNNAGGAKALAVVRSGLGDANETVHDGALRALAEWPDAAAVPELLQVVRATAAGKARDAAFRGYVRLARESSAAAGDRVNSLTTLATLATSADEKKLILAASGDILAVESLRFAMPYLTDAAVIEEASSVAVRISEKLEVKDAADIGPALNQVLKSSKSQPVLDKARKRLEQLKLPVL